jgi:sialic acid synthase SpsE
LIDAAAESGAGCAKFQYVYADEIIHPETGIVPLPSGDVRLYDMFKRLERDQDFYRRLKAKTESRGLIFLCTPFGAQSARELVSLEPSILKIASPELNHLPLLRQAAESGIPTILSSGVSTLSDIETALSFFSSPIALLHCVTAYPAPASDYNLRLLKNLGGVFGLPIGVSDHSLDPLLVPLLSLSCSGSIIEKHICISRKDPGLDDPIALDPQDFLKMSKAIRRAAGMSDAAIVEELSSEYGKPAVEAALGDGVKRLAASERDNYGRTNRSLHAMGKIEPGEVFGAGNVGILRTEKILRPGLHPASLDHILGRRASRAVPAGQGITWGDVGGF